jgi:hypothetical protein
MKIRSLFAVAALVGLFATPAKAVTVNYDITFDFSSASLTDVVGHLAINFPPATSPGTYTTSTLAGIISSFSVTFTNPAASYSCTGDACVFSSTVPGGFTGLTFNGSGVLTAIGASFNKGDGNGANAGELKIGNADFAATGLFFQLNPTGNGNGDRVSGITITQVAAVPGPIVGAGIPGLVMAFGGLIAWRRRRNQAAVA